jgi:hypothetical protein
LKKLEKRAQIVINELEKADPSSIVADREWPRIEVECDVTDNLWEVADRLFGRIKANRASDRAPKYLDTVTKSSRLVKSPQLYRGTVVVNVVVWTGLRFHCLMAIFLGYVQFTRGQ